jgi:hypothetical protein
MKRLLFILIPSFILATIIFLVVQAFFLRSNEKGALQVTAAPQSKVYLNNQYIGQTPLCKCDVNDMVRTGDYTIRVVPNSGKFSEFQEKVTITKSVLTVVDRKFGDGATSEGSVITLQPLKDGNKRDLLVLSIPDKSEVLLDNTPSGFTPVLLHDVTESDHELTIRKTGYAEKNVRIRTPSGYKLIATVYLGVDEDGTSSGITPTSSASPSATPTPTSTQSSVSISQTPTGFLRVHAAASLSSAETARVTPGQTFPLVSETTGWYEIKLKDGSTGWISDQYATKQ